jgi:putative membrane protein
MMGWGYDGGGSGGWALMMLAMVIFWGFVVIGIVAIFRGTRTRDAQTGVGGTSAPPTAAGILDERFARGEIEADEYRARKDALANR